jgi:DNA-binding NarL/FixJ family response regulator
VMIVDDHLVVREGLRKLLEVGDDIEVIGEANDGFECLRLLEKLHPDIIFMDVKMPGISGIETTRLVCEKYPDVRIIMLTIYGDEQFVLEAIRAGAKGYLLKSATREDLVKAVDHVVSGRAFLDPNVTDGVLVQLKCGHGQGEAQEKAQLTQREFEVLKSITSGMKDRDIADALNISEHTVRSHIKSIYRKLKVSSRSQAAVQAMQRGIIGRG